MSNEIAINSPCFTLNKENITMKTNSKALLSAVVLSMSATLAHAQDPFSISANVALTTDYVFRGVSQTLEDPALQGGFDLNHSSGFYIGTWGSNVKYVESNNYSDGANLELDAYLGFANELTNGLSYDLGYAHYMYPGADENLDYDFGEFYLKFGYNILSLEYYYSPEFFGKSGKAHYVNLGGAYEFPQGFSLGASVGYSDFVGSQADYTDWKLFVGTSVAGVDFELAYVDTDIKDVPQADARAVFTISKTF
jgi:uncharacterized protein (TIGR02001 family)